MTPSDDPLTKLRAGVPVTSLSKQEALKLVRSIDKRRARGEPLPAVVAVPQQHADGWQVKRVTSGRSA